MMERAQCDVEGCGAAPVWYLIGNGPSDFLGVCEAHKVKILASHPSWGCSPYDG